MINETVTFIVSVAGGYFLAFLREWVEEGEKQETLSSKEKGQLCLNRPTNTGCHITGTLLPKKSKSMEGVCCIISIIKKCIRSDLNSTILLQYLTDMFALVKISSCWAAELHYYTNNNTNL